jgi:hypothetical protein
MVWKGLSACAEGIMEKYNGLNLPILHGFRHFCFSINGHSCRFCLVLRTWAMLRPTSYFKIFISSTFSPLCQAASTRCQLWPALLGSPFSSLGAITGAPSAGSVVHNALGYGGRNPVLWDGILEHLQRCSVCDSRQ